MSSDAEKLEEKMYGIAGNLVAEKRAHASTQERLVNALAKVNEITNAITEVADVTDKLEVSPDEGETDTFRRYMSNKDYHCYR